MTNYNNEKDRRLRGSMAPKTEEDVALAGTNSSETQDKPEALAGSNSGEPKEIAALVQTRWKKKSPTSLSKTRRKRS